MHIIPCFYLAILHFDVFFYFLYSGLEHISMEFTLYKCILLLLLSYFYVDIRSQCKISRRKHGLLTIFVYLYFHCNVRMCQDSGMYQNFHSQNLP